MSKLDLVSAAKRWAEIRPEYEDILGALARVWEVTEDASVSLDIPPGLDEHRRLKLEEGLPLLSRSELPYDETSAPGLFKRVLSALIRPDHPDLEALENLARLAEEDDEPIHGLLRAFLAEDGSYIEELAGRCLMRPEALTFLAKVTLKPSLEYLRQKLADRIEDSDWHEGLCPLCGVAPDMAKLEGEGGAKSLHCALCGQVWSFDRLACPHCDRSDPGIISYFKADEEKEEGLRVDYCSKCNSYVKTIDRRVIAEDWPWEVLYVWTWHLDRLATRRGLKAAPQRTAGGKLS